MPRHTNLAALRQTNREYARSNRENWSTLGFRSFNALVHDDERTEVLAELEVRKCDAMVAMAENPKTPMDQLRIMSQRNMTTLPSKGDFTEMEALAAASRAKVEVLKMLDIARNYIKRYRGIEAHYERVDSEEKRVGMAAKAVAYSAACNAYARLARVMLDSAPKRDTTIFGLRGAQDDNDV